MAFNDPNVPDDLMCQVYLPLQITMQPLEYNDCMNFMMMNRFNGALYTVSLPVFFPGDDGGPPYFVANITKTKGLNIDNYDMFFIFLLDQNGQILPAMDIEQAIMINNVPMYNYTTMGIQEAIPWIQQFLFDAFDPTLPPELFCMIYSGPTMYNMQPLCEMIEYYQML